MQAMNPHTALDLGLQQRDVLTRAAVLLEAGEGDQAKQILGELRPEQISNAREALIAAEMLLDVHLLVPALAAVERAGVLNRDDPEVAELRAECRYRLDLPMIQRGDGRAIRAILDRLNSLVSPPRGTGRSHVHVVCRLDAIGGTERRALNLHRHLSGHTQTTLWSTHPVHSMYLHGCEIRLITADAAPSGGTLVLVGTYFPCGDWLVNGRFDRVVICHNLVDNAKDLLARMGQIEKNPARPRVQLTFPSQMFRDMCDLPGLVEYSPVDLAHFRRISPAADSTAGLAIGRHGRAFSLKFHPNDPAFFRGLLARGHRVRLLGGTVIERTFAHDKGAKPELIEVGTLGAKDFLAGLDVFIYRKHPQWVETGGAVILEAMAMELPVVIFPEHCGCAELIVDAENGFLVSSEAEAFEVIECLRADPELRRRIGTAARQTLVDLQRRQESEIIDYYCG